MRGLGWGENPMDNERGRLKADLHALLQVKVVPSGDR
jgi:hypothetical protein